MSIRIKARAGESAEQMLRRFKKMCEKEGLTKDVKRQAYYEKPSEKRRRAMRKSIKRVQQLGMPFVPRGGKMMGPPGRNGGGPNGPRGPMGRGPGGGGRGPMGRGPGGGRGGPGARPPMRRG